MAVSDELLVSIFLFAFNYLVLYKKNRFIGNIVYIAIGFGLMYVFLGELYMYAGIIIAVIGTINLIYDLFKPLKME